MDIERAIRGARIGVAVERHEVVIGKHLVADIFEALTAWDRPYKSSKTLRESLDIMEGFRQRNHIDPDVYELFLKADIPQRYAAEYLKPEQSDLA